MRLPLPFALLLLSLACSDENAAPKTKAPGDAVIDAAPAKVEEKVAVPAPSTASPIAKGTHLDPSEVEYQPRAQRPQKRSAPAVEITLRSSPPGAKASIDGIQVGITPTFYELKRDGRAHEFTFAKEGYAVARYRFVATRNGVVHGTLKRLVAAPDAGPAR
jgi:hypothetical protein